MGYRNGELPDYRSQQTRLLRFCLLSQKVIMSNGMSVSTFAAKSHDQPDEVRSPDTTRVEVVRLPGFTLGRLKMQPGWRWSAEQYAKS
jgi:hypothetical protein